MDLEPLGPGAAQMPAPPPPTQPRAGQLRAMLDAAPRQRKEALKTQQALKSEYEEANKDRGIAPGFIFKLRVKPIAWKGGGTRAKVIYIPLDSLNVGWIPDDLTYDTIYSLLGQVPGQFGIRDEVNIVYPDSPTVMLAEDRVNLIYITFQPGNRDEADVAKQIQEEFWNSLPDAT